MSLTFSREVPLAPMTTLELGGPARLFVEVGNEDELSEALEEARCSGLDVVVLGGGSNIVAPDEGFDGLVVRLALRGLLLGVSGDPSVVRVAASEPWDRVVQHCVDRNLAGIECLSGIPGSTGATPVQNVGAYGQEVSQVVRRVRALDRNTGEIVELPPGRCAFAYRDSAFKRNPHRWIVLEVELALRPDGSPRVRYAELARALGEDSPSLATVRRTVLALRRRKSMVIDSEDPNRRSVGSFFTNPVVSEDRARSVALLAVQRGLVSRPEQVPQFPAGEGRIKLPAAWLIEQSGIPKGLRRGNVGISSCHALALVHHGNGSTRELLELAAFVRDRVQRAFDIRLVPEPVLIGTATL